VAELTVEKIRACLRILKEAEERHEAMLDEAARQWRLYGRCEHPYIFAMMPAMCGICGRVFD
jgi:rubrerythrin